MQFQMKKQTERKALAQIGLLSFQRTSTMIFFQCRCFLEVVWEYFF